MLLIVAIVVSIAFSTLLVRRWLPVKYAVPLLLVKYSILVLNIGFDSLFLPYHTRPGDSISYYMVAKGLVVDGHTTFSLLAAGFEPISAATGTGHPFYYFWNVLWISTLGDTIFAPMVVNVLVLVVGSVIATMLVAELGYSHRYQQLFLAFTLVHWEILVWPALMNLKDPLVATLSILLLYFVILGIRRSGRARVVAIAGGLAVSALFYYIRFYVPGLVGVAIAIWGVSELVWRRRWGYIWVLSAGGVASLELLRRRGLKNVNRLVDLSNFPGGVIRFPLTPTPWDTAKWYSFLVLPSAIHWLTFPIAIFGGIWLAMNRIERLLMIYLVVIVCFFAVVPQLLGPRHRFQAVFVISFAQFHGLWTIIQRRYDLAVHS